MKPVTPGNLAELMVLAAMSDLRVPLYQLGDRLKDVDLSSEKTHV